MPKGETPSEWGARNAEEFVKSTKESLGKEMYFAIRLNLVASFLFAIGAGLAVGFWSAWAFGLMAGTFVLFGVSLYWAWYIRRGLNRRWEKEMAAEKFAARRQETEVRRPPEDLGQISRIEGPRRSYGND